MFTSIIQKKDNDLKRFLEKRLKEELPIQEEEEVL